MKGATASGFGSELWTCPRIVELIKRFYGINYHIDNIPRLMASLGFSCQKPELQARERNESDIQHWMHYDWQRIKKAHRKNAHIVFIDETGFLLHPLLRRTWAPVGKMPVLLQRTRHHRHVSTIGAISISPSRRPIGRYLRFYVDISIRQQQIVGFLRQLRRHLHGSIIVVWDRLNAHRGIAVRDYINSVDCIELEYLPAYCPQLNPNEYGWSYIKYRRVREKG